MKIEEVVVLIERMFPVVGYREAKYGVWVFDINVHEDTNIQVRIRQFPRTKMEQCMYAIGAAIEQQLKELGLKAEVNYGG